MGMFSFLTGLMFVPLVRIANYADSRRRVKKMSEVAIEDFIVWIGSIPVTIHITGVKNQR
jgi:hypothetical protein